MKNIIPQWLHPIEMDVNIETSFSVNVIYLINGMELITYQHTYHSNGACCLLLHNPYKIMDSKLTDWVPNLVDSFHIIPASAVLMLDLPNKFMADTYLDIISSLVLDKDDIQ